MHRQVGRVARLHIGIFWGKSIKEGRYFKKCQCL